MKNLRQWRLSVLPISLVLLVSLTMGTGTAHAVGEQVGRIKGVVSDASTGIALPGMQITARSPALIGDPRQVLSDQGGRFEIISLPPGLYTVEFEYAGARRVSRQVQVRAGETAPLNLAWTADQAGVDELALTETRNLTAPDSAQTGTVMGADTMKRLPTGRSYQSAAQLVPGVSGRTNSSGGANPNIRGGLQIHNRFLVDGLDITDPVTGTFSANMNFESIGSVQVLTGGMEAQYNALGGVINVIGAGGSDEFHANASIYFNHQDLSATGSFGPQLYNGVQPFNDSEVGPNQSAQFGLNVGGPILRKKLWFNATYELRLSEISSIKGPPLGAPPYDIQHPSETSQIHLMRAKLAYAASQAHRFTLTVAADPAYFNNSSGYNPNRLLGIAESRQNQGGFFTVGHWDWFISKVFHLNLQAGYQVNTIEYGAQGRLDSISTAGCDKFSAINCTYDPNRAQHVNLTDGTIWYQGDPYQDDSRMTVQVDPSLSIRGRLFGTHDAKVGIQTRLNRRKQSFEAQGGSIYQDLGGGRLEAGLCDPMSADGNGCYRRIDYQPYSVKESGYSIGAYVQDRWWTPLTWLTVVPGLRVDYGHTEDRNGRTVSNLLGFGPRFAMVADLTGDGRTIFSAAYGRSNEVLSLLPAANFDSNEAALTTEWEWDPTMKAFSTKVSSSGGPGGVEISKDLETPHTDEITFNLRRQIFHDTVAGTDYTWKRLSNLWDWEEINQIWDPSGQRVVDWVNPARRNETVYRYGTPDDNHRTYQGFNLYFEGRPTPKWDFNASYTLSWLYGPGITSFDQIQGVGQGNNPRNKRYFDGFLPEDVRHMIKAFGAYQLGPINIGANVRYESGVPRTKHFFSAKDGDYVRYRSPIGTEPGPGNDVEQITELRLPDFFQADLRLTANLLPARLQQDLTFIVDIFNVLGSRRPTGVVTEDLEEFGQVAGRQRPLRVQLALNYSY
jgi:hypothetical protein